MKGWQRVLRTGRTPVLTNRTPTVRLVVLLIVCLVYCSHILHTLFQDGQNMFWSCQSEEQKKKDTLEGITDSIMESWYVKLLKIMQDRVVIM